MPDNRSHGRSKAGVELTDEVLDQMAKEAEDGLDITDLRRRRGRPAMGSGPAESLPVCLDPELRQALDERAAADKTTASDIVREALRPLPQGQLTACYPNAHWDTGQFELRHARADGAPKPPVHCYSIR